MAQKKKKIKRILGNRDGLTREESKMKNQKAYTESIKQRRTILIGGVAVAAIFVLLLVMSALGVFGKKASTTTVTLKSDGTVVFEEVVEVDSKTDKSEVKKYAKETIDEYNLSKGSNMVKLNKVSTSGNRIYLKTTYKDAECYSDFTSYEFFVGTIKEAEKAGYVFDGTFSKVKSGKKKGTIEVSKVTKDSSDNVIILDQGISVVVPGKIKYVSETFTETVGNKVNISNDVLTFIVY